MLHRSVRWSLFLAISFGGLLAAGFLNEAWAENWTRFRGENGLGVSGQTGFPTTWSPGDVAWNIELPGEGHSSPVIWGDKLFVTSADDEGRIRYLFCLNAETGDEIWSRVAGLSASPKHQKSSWASSTPATDGERVYVAFADRENYTLAAYDFDGNILWRRDLGPFESQHGLGASPIVFEDLVIAVNDQDGPSFAIAFDRLTGRTVWSVLRSFNLTSYATPIIVRDEGRAPQLIITCGAMGVISLGPHTGRMNWVTGALPARTVGSPTLADGLIIQACGGGGVGKFLVAVDPLGDYGDGASRIKYTRDRILPYVPTPVGHEGHVYLWNDNGVVSCVETATGNNMWTERIGGNYSSSPICLDGKLYNNNEDGEVVVLAASPEYKLYGKTPLGDPSHASPSVGAGRLYFRTFHRLVCLEAALAN